MSYVHNATEKEAAQKSKKIMKAVTNLIADGLRSCVQSQDPLLPRLHLAGFLEAIAEWDTAT